MFNETFAQFYRFAGHGNVPYGNGLPEGGFRDNGKTSGLAFGLNAASMVSPEGENSVCAKARDNSSMKAFYATNWFHAAHTGGGMGEIWHHAVVSKMREKRPVQYRSNLDTRRWVMDLSRRFDGSIGIAGMDDRYDRSATEDPMAWGTFFALTYTYPRKQLQLFGAPRSKWAKHVDLPRPWGNETDHVFHSIEPIPGGPLTMDDLLKEKVGSDDSWAVINRPSDPALTDGTLLKYNYHPEYDLRSLAMDQVTKRGRADLVLPLLKSPDARLRQAGLLGLTGMFKGAPVKGDLVTPKNGKPPGPVVDKPKDTIEFLPDGKIGKSNYFKGYFWSGDMLIAMHDDQALKLEVRTVGGRDFLIVERGGFHVVPKTEEEATAAIGPDWHCGYHVYVRQ